MKLFLVHFTGMIEGVYVGVGVCTISKPTHSHTPIQSLLTLSTETMNRRITLNYKEPLRRNERDILPLFSTKRIFKLYF